MSSIVDEFMKEFEEIRYEDDIVGVIKNDPVSGIIGFEVAILFYWSYKKELLTEEVSKIISAHDDETVLTKRLSLFNFMSKTIGNNLWVRFYKPEVRYFIENYVHLGGSHYQFNYITDLKKLYPQVDSFFELCEDMELKSQYNRIKNMLDERYTDAKAISSKE